MLVNVRSDEVMYLSGRVDKTSEGGIAGGPSHARRGAVGLDRDRDLGLHPILLLWPDVDAEGNAQEYQSDGGMVSGLEETSDVLTERPFRASRTSPRFDCNEFAADLDRLEYSDIARHSGSLACCNSHTNHKSSARRSHALATTHSRPNVILIQKVLRIRDIVSMCARPLGLRWSCWSSGRALAARKGTFRSGSKALRKMLLLAGLGNLGKRQVERTFHNIIRSINAKQA